MRRPARELGNLRVELIVEFLEGSEQGTGACENCVAETDYQTVWDGLRADFDH